MHSSCAGYKIRSCRPIEPLLGQWLFSSDLKKINPQTCSNGLQFSPTIFFSRINSFRITNSYGTPTICSFALLLCFRFAKQVHQRSPLPSAATSNTLPPLCHRASFPQGKFWSNKTWEFNIWLGLLDIWLAQGSATELESSATSTAHTQINCTQHRRYTWACPQAGDLLCLCLTDDSCECNDLTCPKSTAFIAHVLTICVVCDSETSAPWKGQVCYEWATQHTYRNTWTQQPRPSSSPIHHYRLQVSQRSVLVTAKRALQCRAMITSCCRVIHEVPNRVTSEWTWPSFPPETGLLTTAFALTTGTGLPGALQVPLKARGESSGASS